MANRKGRSSSVSKIAVLRTFFILGSRVTEKRSKRFRPAAAAALLVVLDDDDDASKTNRFPFHSRPLPNSRLVMKRVTPVYQQSPEEEDETANNWAMTRGALVIFCWHWRSASWFFVSCKLTHQSIVFQQHSVPLSLNLFYSPWRFTLMHKQFDQFRSIHLLQSCHGRRSGRHRRPPASCLCSCNTSTNLPCFDHVPSRMKRQGSYHCDSCRLARRKDDHRCWTRLCFVTNDRYGWRGEPGFQCGHFWNAQNLVSGSLFSFRRASMSYALYR
jgi:hypothetical protein